MRPRPIPRPIPIPLPLHLVRHFPLIVSHLLRVRFWNCRRCSRCSILFHDRYSSQCPDGHKIGVGVFIVIVAGKGAAAVAVADAVAPTEGLMGIAMSATVAVIALKRGRI